MSNKIGFVGKFLKAPAKEETITSNSDFSTINPSIERGKVTELETRHMEALSYWRTIERPDGSLYLIPSNK